MLTVVAFILVLSVLVFVHELGHFIVAKRTGVVVEEFAFGYPPRLLKYWQNEGKIVLDGKEMVVGRKTDVSRQVEGGGRVVYQTETQDDRERHGGLRNLSPRAADRKVVHSEAPACRAASAGQPKMD